MNRFNIGDKVKRSDADNSSVPAYKNMRGTVVDNSSVVPGLAGLFISVQWDIDPKNKPTPQKPEWLKLADD